MQEKCPNLDIYTLEHLQWLYNKSDEKSYLESFSYIDTGCLKKIERENLITRVVSKTSELNLSLSTGLLACAYLDKFLSKKPLMSRDHLDLVCILSLSIAAKYKESGILNLESIKMMLKNQYTLDAIVTTERYILSNLDWQLGLLTPCDLIQSLLNHTFEASISAGFIDMTFKFAAVCYADADIALLGCYYTAVSSILLTLDRLGFNRVKEEWLVLVQSNFVLDKDKVSMIMDQVMKKLLSSN